MGSSMRTARLDQTEPGLKLKLGWSGLAFGPSGGRVRLPAEQRVEHVLMAVALAAARRLGALHHRLKPAGHVHLQNLVAPDETVLLWQRGETRE